MLASLVVTPGPVMSAKSERNRKAALNNTLTSSQENPAAKNQGTQILQAYGKILLHKLSQLIAGSAQLGTKLMESG